MSIGTIYGKDSLTILVPVTDQETDEPLNLTGATFEVAALSGVNNVGGTAEVVGAATDGNVGVTFAAGSFEGKKGDWAAQLRIAIGPEVQTVAVILFKVESAIPVPAE